MKKLICLILAAAMVITMTGCSSIKLIKELIGDGKPTKETTSEWEWVVPTMDTDVTYAPETKAEPEIEEEYTAEEWNEIGTECVYAGEYERAFEAFSKAAEMGSVIAISNLGYMYYNGYYVDQDYVRAYELFEAAADEGDGYSYYFLGYMNYWGEGRKVDLDKAFDMYYEGAMFGDIECMAELAYMYLVGEGCEQSDMAGYRWAKEAADAGDTYAMYLVGYAYYFGIAIGQDYEKAYEYWQMAADQGEQNAIESLEEYFGQ